MKKANILATAALATLLAACSNDSDVLNTPDYADTPIGLNVNVGPMATRAGYDDTNLTRSSFGLYLTTEGTNSDERYNCTNREVRYESGWTIQGGQLLWKSNDATVTYYAYLPYTGTVGDAASYAFTVKTDQSNENNVKASDLLWTGGRQDATAGTALDINFQHALSKLNVTLKKGSELDEGVTFKSVKLSNCATEIVVNLLEGTIVKTTNSGQTITLYAATPNKQYECILVPQTFAQSLKVEITDNNGKVYTFIKSDKELTFSSGKQYTLNLTVGRDKVTTGTISAESWGEEQQGGDLVTE